MLFLSCETTIPNTIFFVHIKLMINIVHVHNNGSCSKLSKVMFSSTLFHQQYTKHTTFIIHNHE